MKISLNWIKELLQNPLDIDPLELSEKLSVTLAEVEGIEEIGLVYEPILVAEILDIQKHENSDKLSIVEIDYSQGKSKVVCGAKNIKVGQKVPYIRAGNSLPDGTLIKKVEIRGFLSEGMICSEKELSLGDDHSGILILSDINYISSNLLVNGASIADVLNLKDTIISIENKALTHRPDCFSHVGMAREIATLTNNSLSMKSVDFSVIPTTKETVEIVISEPELCPRYSAIVIKDIEIKDSPLWLKYRLQSIGQRPINNIVDATNMVMWLTGQPLHAFDYDKIPNNKIVVRKAKADEIIVTIDGVERTLDKDMLVIADDKNAIAVAGVMGGQSSEIDDNTKNIIIESANFNYANIRNTSTKLGLRTDASTIFEKGQDPNKTVDAIKIISDLIIDIASGDIATDIVDLYDNKLSVKNLEFRNNLIKRRLGFDIDKNRVIEILESLEIKVENKLELPGDKDFGNYVSELTIPTFRQDINIEEDILEELARFWGYEKIRPTLPKRDLSSPKLNKTRDLIKAITENLSMQGMNEIYSYGLVGSELYSKSLFNIDRCIKVINPISEEFAYLRNSLIPSLLSKALLNSKNYDEFELFEVSRVYFKDLLDKSDQKLPYQPYKISGLIYTTGKDLYLNAKGRLDSLFQALGLGDLIYTRLDKLDEEAPRHLIPTQSAKIYIGDSKEELGTIGNISPKVLINFDIEGSISVFDIDLDMVAKYSSENINYKPIPKYQSSQRDLSFVVDKRVEVGNLVTDLVKMRINHLVDIVVADIFEDESKLGAGMKSVTLRFVMQSDKRTLSEDDINAVMESVKKEIEIKYEGKLRK